MNIYIILSIILLHWIADFVCQTHWQASNKSKNNRALTLHILFYTAVFLPFAIITMGQLGGVFLLVIFMLHWITDYFTSRINSKLWNKGEVHNFFVSVGFDQVLHYFQLFLTYYILTK